MVFVWPSLEVVVVVVQFRTTSVVPSIPSVSVLLVVHVLPVLLHVVVEDLLPQPEAVVPLAPAPLEAHVSTPAPEFP